jgi:hypothetical protein
LPSFCIFAINREVRRESNGPMPAPVATNNAELNTNVKAKKLLATGRRIQSFEGGSAMRRFVQSHAAMTMIVAEEPVAHGIVAKACHSASGVELKREVDVYGMCA